MATDQALRILVSLSECKTVLGYDDRDDDFTRFLLVAASATVESHLLRRILKRTLTQYFDSLGSGAYFLKEYPVREILSVHEDRARLFGDTTRLHPEHYYCTPDTESLQEIPSSLTLTPPYRLPRAEKSIKVVYTAGYELSEVPEDLRQAVIELVAWSYTRYKTRRIGSAANDQQEKTIPEHVRTLLESYRRRTV